MKPSLFQKTSVQKDFSKLNKLVYGFPKTGKTTFASEQVDRDKKEPLFIATEDGHHALEVYAVKVTSWPGFLKLMELLEKNQETIRGNHSCFVVDLVSDLDTMCSEFVAEKNNVRHLADMEFGKGFALQKQEFQAAVRRLLDILPTTFIAHSQEKDLMWNGEKIKVQAPSMSKGCLEFVNGKVDVIMWLVPSSTKKLEPEITMKNTTTSIAGTRYKQLARTFRFNPNDPGETYREIQKVFAGESSSPVEPKDSLSDQKKKEPQAAEALA